MQLNDVYNLFLYTSKEIIVVSQSVKFIFFTIKTTMTVRNLVSFDNYTYSALMSPYILYVFLYYIHKCSSCYAFGFNCLEEFLIG